MKPTDKDQILRQISGLLYDAQQYHNQALIVFQKYKDCLEKAQRLQNILDDNRS